MSRNECEGEDNQLCTNAQKHIDSLEKTIAQLRQQHSKVGCTPMHDISSKLDNSCHSLVKEVQSMSQRLDVAKRSDRVLRDG